MKKYEEILREICRVGVKIDYPEEFKKKVKEIFPDNKEIQIALERGSILPCFYLGKCIHSEVVDKTPSLEKLQKQARQVMHKKIQTVTSLTSL